MLNSHLLNRRIRQVQCASQAGYADPSMTIGVPPVQPRMQVRQSQTGAFWTAVVLVCVALTALAGAFTAFLVYMRPVLKVGPEHVSETCQS